LSFTLRASIAPAMLALLTVPLFLRSDPPRSPLHFTPQRIAFHLENDESPQRHAPETMAGGVAVFDYNRDGKLDIFFTNGANLRTLRKDSPRYWNRLFRNDGKGQFTDTTEQAGLAGTGYDIGVAVADYDNDGWPDLFVAGVHGNTLYHNNGDGTFTDVTAKSGLNKPDPKFGPLWSVGGVWMDVNNDGLLDLFVVNYLQWNFNKEPVCATAGIADYCHPKFYGGLPNQLFLNKGNGVFEDISESSGIRQHIGKGMSGAMADYDGDGLPDLFVPSDKTFNLLFHNKGNGKFDEVAFESGVAAAQNGEFISGMGADFHDIDNDGLPDIAFAALNGETFPLFRNLGGGNFEDVTSATGLRALTLPLAGFGLAMYDFDNDGWKDIFASCGQVEALVHEGNPVAQPNAVFHNPGRQGRWNMAVGEAGLDALPPARHRGAAFGDLNGDGRIDAVVTALNADGEIWMNVSRDNNHWLQLSLEGTKSNRDGIGARIKLVTRRGAQYNHFTTSVGYASSSAGPLHFGLGANEKADLIEIRWPSGTLQQLTNVKADQILKVVEPR
jgi:enediyne biosynthesis protein E4